MTATWARLAASARRVKSLRKGSVDEVLPGRGAGGGIEGMLLMGDCWTDDDAVEAARVLMAEAEFILSITMKRVVVYFR
jgi:hypothetical protein